jgi:UDP-glucose 4-epimerase
VHFHRVDPRDEARIGRIVRDLDPTVVVHLGVYEPDARAGPRSAEAWTAAGTRAVLGAAAACRGLERIVVRSGAEIYGRRRGAPLRPDEGVAPDPTTPFGRSLLDVEDVAAAAGRDAGVPVARLRCAPLVGPHLPSPLGRYLRLPAVAVAALADLPFSLLHQEDAAAAFVAAARREVNGAVNVVGTGAVTPRQAARMGGRPTLPTAGPGWLLVRRLADLAGAPVPDHVIELLTRGRAPDGSSAGAALGTAPAYRTPEVVKDLYEWASVTPLRTGEAAA